MNWSMWLICITGVVVCAFFVLMILSLMIVFKRSDDRAEQFLQVDEPVIGYDRYGREL